MVNFPEHLAEHLASMSSPLLLLLMQSPSLSPLSRADEYRRSNIDDRRRAEEDLEDIEKGDLDEGISDGGSHDVGIEGGGGDEASFGTPPPLSSSSTTEEVAIVSARSILYEPRRKDSGKYTFLNG